ncbi:MAG: hypothetical protein J6575_07295 [Bifidobacterium sp.]|nr:hypothetical protein [Bifidobacterium sp.]
MAFSVNQENPMLKSQITKYEVSWRAKLPKITRLSDDSSIFEPLCAPRGSKRWDLRRFFDFWPSWCAKRPKKSRIVIATRALSAKVRGSSLKRRQDFLIAERQHDVK